ncbi:MBG domain-containing protein, partial [Sinomicrobium sp. M5D2P9]
MKKFLLYSFLFGLSSFSQVFGQNITYHGCLNAGFSSEYTLNASGNITDDGINRTIYKSDPNQGDFGELIIIKWNAASDRWEIYFNAVDGDDGPNNELLYSSTVATHPNPPNIAIGNWTNQDGYNCDPLDAVHGELSGAVEDTAPNFPPVITTSGGTTVFQEGDDPVVIDGGLTLSDADHATLAGATVSITANLSSGEDILSFSNTGSGMGNISAGYNTASGVLTLTSAGATATLAQWQSALRAVTYNNTSSNPDTANRTVSFVINDGTANSSPATKVAEVLAVNNDPTISGLPTNVSVLEDATEDEFDISSATISDVDAGSGALTLTLDATGGKFDVASGTGITLTGHLTGHLTLTGNLTDLNHYISIPSNMYFIPDPDSNGNDAAVVQISINDNGNTGAGGGNNVFLGTVNIDITAVNDAPVVVAPSTIAVNEDTPTALTGISFSDVDAGNADVTATLSVDSGTFSATSGGGVTVTGSGTGGMILLGSIADLNTFIASGGVSFTTAPDATANVTLTVVINDGGNTGLGGAKQDITTVTLMVTAVNDAPVNTVPGSQTVDQDHALIFSTGNGNAISVADADAGNGTIRVTLVAVNGLITLSGSTGLSFIEGSDTASATTIFEGTIAAINSAFDGMFFMPSGGFSGAASLQIITNDLGLTGSGGAQEDDDIIAITVNSVNPVISGVQANNPDGTYKIGDVITVTVAFDQAVTVHTAGGTPGLLLETGSVDRQAIYVSGSGSNTLTFHYTVQAGDISPDLDYTSTAALALNGATIQNASGDDAVLTLPAVGGANSIAGQHDIAIDGVAPAVTSVHVPANGYYQHNDVLTFTLNLNENVIVNTGSGIPYLELTIGAVIHQAAYVSGSGTQALTFTYTVQPDDKDLDGIALGSTLVLNGGSINDAAGNNAEPTLNNIAPTNNIFVYSTVPSVILSGTPGTNTPFTLTITFSEAVTGFIVADISAGNAMLSNLQTADNTVYTALVTPTVDGEVSLQVPADVAVNIAGNGNTASNVFRYDYDTTAPVVPEGLEAVPGDSEVILNWTANPESDLAHYKIYGGTTADPTTLLETVNTPLTTYTHGGLTNGTRYYYRISAVDNAGNESEETAGVNALPKGNQAISFDALTDQTYGDAPFALTATASSGLTVSYTSSDPSVASVSGDILTVHQVGTVEITASQAGNDMYNAATTVARSLIIHPKAITITAGDQTKVYGEDDPEWTYTYSPELVSGDNFSGTLERVPGEDIGVYAIEQGTLALNLNYELTFEGANLTITPAVITGITFNDGSFVYDGTARSLSLEGTLPEGTSVSYGNNSRTDVGTQEVTATLTGTNYETLELTANLTITPAVITGITFNDGSFVYNGTARSLSLEGTLPEGTSVSYVNNSRTDVGTQEVTATLTGTNYETLELTANLT